MKKSLVFSIVFLISIFSFNIRSKALNTECANVILGEEKHIILNNTDIKIDENTVDSLDLLQINTLLPTWQNKRWYVFEDNNTGEVVVILTNWWATPWESSSWNNINYLRYNGSLNTYDYIIFKIKNNQITSTKIYNNYSSYVIYSFSSSGGTVVNTSYGSISYCNTTSSSCKTYEIPENNTCSYIPSTINAPTFEANYTQYNDQNIAVNLTINFKDFDLEKYDYLLSFDEGKSYKNINTNIDSGANYILTKLENFNVTAKVVDKSNNNSIFASYYVDSLTTLDNFIVFYEDSTKNEYVTVDNKEYLYSKTIRMYPITQVENLQYRYTTDNEVYQYFSDVIEKKSFRNENITVEVVDKYYNVIKTFSYSVTGFESSAELGETIIFDEFIDSEDKEKIIVYLRILNANSSHNYYVKQENSSYKKVYPWNWQSGQYYFESTDKITNYCARITNEKNEVIQEECYTIKGFSTTKNFHSFMVQIKKFINNQKDTINALSNAVDDFFLMIPDPIFNLLTFLYFLLCLGAIIWNVRR